MVSCHVSFWHACCSLGVEPLTLHPHLFLPPPLFFLSGSIAGATRVCHAPPQERSHQRDARKWFKDVLKRKLTEAFQINLSSIDECARAHARSHTHTHITFSPSCQTHANVRRRAHTSTQHTSITTKTWKNTTKQSLTNLGYPAHKSKASAWTTLPLVLC